MNEYKKQGKLYVAKIFEDKCRWKQLKNIVSSSKDYYAAAMKEVPDNPTLSGSYMVLVELEMIMADLERQTAEDWVQDDINES